LSGNTVFDVIQAEWLISRVPEFKPDLTGLPDQESQEWENNLMGG
jgi:hypothetical protein